MTMRGVSKITMLGALLLWQAQTRAVEILGHIAEDSEMAAESQAPVVNNDRRITYRVICTPGGEVLPDCEQAVHDDEAAPPAAAVAMPDMPPDAEDLAEERENEKPTVEPAAVTSPRASTKSAKQTSAKPVKQKSNPNKKTTAKKAEAKKKPAKITTKKQAGKKQVSSKSTPQKTKKK